VLDTAVLAMDSVGDMDKGSVGCSKAMDSMPAAADVGADSTFSEADEGCGDGPGRPLIPQIQPRAGGALGLGLGAGLPQLLQY